MRSEIGENGYWIDARNHNRNASCEEATLSTSTVGSRRTVGEGWVDQRGTMSSKGGFRLSLGGE